ncbi:MAG: DUF1295 domain-containing protein [Candidatus Thorarchaeota archaeon]
MSEVSTIEIEKPSFGKMIWAFTIVTLSYILAGGAAIGIGYPLSLAGVDPIWITLIADVGATIVIFIFSVIFNNVSFYDPYWSVQPIAIAIYWMFLPQAATADIYRQAIVLGCISFWGVRLTANWIRGWKGLKHEDWRYVKYRKDTPKLFWFIAFTGLEMMPTLLVYLGCISIYPAIVLSDNPLNYFDIIAVIITVGATLIEFIADEQMKIFTQMNTNSKEIMRLGLWGISRHPNYFGEVTFWWGLFFFALAADLKWWWTFSGPLAITLLFIFISVPLMENHQIKKRPEYLEYKKKVSMLVPWFPRK